MTSDSLPSAPRKPRLVVSFEDEPGAGVVAAETSPQPAATAAPPAVSFPPVVDAPAPSAEPARPQWVYSPCAVMPVLEGQFGPEDSLIMPVAGLEADSVLLEPRDGHDVARLLCNTVEVRAGDNNRRVLRASSIRAQLLVTDARITVACSKYDKGGGWIGGPSALVLNAGSKLLAAQRRRGKMLVGQIRYPWINAVYAQNKGGWKGSEMLRIIVKSGGQPMRLELTLPNDVDATAVGAEIIRRAARFRLRHETKLDASERAALTELAEIPPLVWRKETKTMAGHRFPTFWPVGEQSALLGLGDAK